MLSLAIDTILARLAQLEDDPSEELTGGNILQLAEKKAVSPEAAKADIWKVRTSLLSETTQPKPALAVPATIAKATVEGQKVAGREYVTQGRWAGYWRPEKIAPAAAAPPTQEGTRASSTAVASERRPPPLQGLSRAVSSSSAEANDQQRFSVLRNPVALPNLAPPAPESNHLTAELKSFPDRVGTTIGNDDIAQSFARAQETPRGDTDVNRKQRTYQREERTSPTFKQVRK